MGDWICPDCGNVNYTLRMFCNKKGCKRKRTGLEYHVARGGHTTGVVIEREKYEKTTSEPVSNPAVEAALEDILAGTDDWSDDKEQHATYAELVRNMKRVSRRVVDTWGEFIANEGSNILDPYRHDTGALLRFLQCEGPTWLSEHGKAATYVAL